MPQYELTYFDIRGLAEPARLILSYAGADWKDTRMPFTGPGQSTVPDEVKAKCQFGQVPLLEFEGHTLVQSFAIFRYLARKFNLAGKNETEEAKVDEVADGARDFFMTFIPAILEQDESKKAELFKTSFAATKTKFLSVFNHLAQQNGGYLVGKSLTWADIVLAQYIDNIQRLSGVQLLVSDLPALKKLYDNVFNAKGIKEWVAKRPETKY